MNRISQYKEERSDSDLEGLFSDQDGKLPRKKIESLFSSIMEVRESHRQLRIQIRTMAPPSCSLVAVYVEESPDTELVLSSPRPGTLSLW